MKNFIQGDKIYLEWLDAGSSNGEWQSQDDFKKFRSEPFIVKHLAFYHSSDEHYLYVYSHIIEDKDPEEVLYGGLSKIPVLWIKTIKKI